MADCDCDQDWNGGHWPPCPAFDHTGHLCAICQPEAVDRIFQRGLKRLGKEDGAA